MAEHRWSKFWWADWYGDKSLRMCSPAARGIWMDLLCLAHEADPQGHVLVNGKSPSMRQLAMVVGTDEKTVVSLLAELEDAGVFDRSDAGTIVSRRMVRDAAISLEGRENIAKRRDRQPPQAPPTSPPPNLEAEAKKLEAESKQAAAREQFQGRQGANGAGPPKWEDAAIEPEATDHRPCVNGFYLDFTFEEALEAANMDPARSKATWKPVIAWLKDGIEPSTILAAIRRCTERADYEPPHSLAYFDRPVREEKPH